MYTRESRIFRVTETAAPSAHYGGIAVFYCEAEHFAIEELHLHNSNVFILQLVTGRKWWNIVGWYISPRNALTIEDVVLDVRDRP